MHKRYEYNKQWQIEHYEYRLAYKRQWREKNREKQQEENQRYYKKHKEKELIRVKEYQKTEKGKIVDKRHSAKRKRNLGWIPLFENPFDKSEKVDWHHISNTFVIAIPKDLHQLYYGKNHRENEMRIIEQIYGGIKNDFR